MYQLVSKVKGGRSWNIGCHDDVDFVMDHMVGFEGPLLLLDLDGTLRNGDHRLHLLPSDLQLKQADEAGERNRAFDAFHAAGADDSPMLECISFIKNLTYTGRYFIVILTSCSYTKENADIARQQLEDWGVPYNLFFMRGSDNHVDAPQFKVDFLRMFENFGREPENILAVDDCIKNCDAFRKMGAFALQVENYKRFSK